MKNLINFLKKKNDGTNLTNCDFSAVAANRRGRLIHYEVEFTKYTALFHVNLKV